MRLSFTGLLPRVCDEDYSRIYYEKDAIISLIAGLLPCKGGCRDVLDYLYSRGLYATGHSGPGGHPARSCIG